MIKILLFLLFLIYFYSIIKYIVDIMKISSCINTIEAFLKSVQEKYARVDILVNNAGVTKDGLLMKMSEEDFSRVVDINLKGTFNCIRHVSRMMLKQRSGRIISL